MATLEQLRAQREKLSALRADGILSARFGEEEVRYKSDSEMAAAIAAIDREINAQAGTPPRRFFPIFNDGFN